MAYELYLNKLFKTNKGDIPGGPGLIVCAPNAGGTDLIPGQGTRTGQELHATTTTSQRRLKSLHTMSKIQGSQIKINIKNMFKTRKNFQLSKVWSRNRQVQVQRTVRRGGAFEVRSGSIVGQGWVLFFPRSYFWGFPGGASGKESACQCRRCKRGGFNPWVRKIPWGRKWQPTPVFLPGKSHGRRSLEGSSP